MTAGLFDVHVFTVVRILIAAIPAATPEAAIQQALESPALTALDCALISVDAEWAEEHSHFLVDVVGDEAHDESRWFHSHDEPLLDLVRELVQWSESGRDPVALELLLSKAQAALKAVV